MKLLTDLKGETDKNAIIVSDVNISLAAMDRSSKHKVNKEISAFMSIWFNVSFINFYRNLYPKTIEDKFFSSVHGSF